MFGHQFVHLWINTEQNRTFNNCFGIFLLNWHNSLFYWKKSTSDKKVERLERRRKGKTTNWQKTYVNICAKLPTLVKVNFYLLRVHARALSVRVTRSEQINPNVDHSQMADTTFFSVDVMCDFYLVKSHYTFAWTKRQRKRLIAIEPKLKWQNMA